MTGTVYCMFYAFAIKVVDRRVQVDWSPPPKIRPAKRALVHLSACEECGSDVSSMKFCRMCQALRIRR